MVMEQLKRYRVHPWSWGKVDELLALYEAATPSERPQVERYFEALVAAAPAEHLTELLLEIDRAVGGR